MNKQELLATAIQNFCPTSTRTVVLWLHTDGQEHFVGIIKNLVLKGDDIDAEFVWMLRVEPNGNGKRTHWKVISGSKKDGYCMAFPDSKLKSLVDNELEIRYMDDTINLYTDTKRVEETQEILSRYE